jgi:deoxyribose-phosphate aldolase
MIKDYLEATNLNEKANRKEIRDSVIEALNLGCVGFCTYMTWSLVVDNTIKSLGKEGQLKRIYVIGFFTGSPLQIFRDLQYIETTQAEEYDLVFPLPVYAVGDLTMTKKILDKVRESTKGKILKVIIETNILRDLPDWEKKFKDVIKLCEDTGADYIKTNTGRFERKVPIEDDIRIIRRITELPMKAAGGIKTYELAKKLVDLGVKRIGTSSVKAIIEGEPK